MFTIVKYLGAAYLVYLGIRRLLAKTAEDRPGTPARQGLRHGVRQGMVVAVLNPKTAFFFLAFLPQFVTISPGAPAVWQQTLLLGLIFVIMGTGTDSAFALAAGTASGWLKRRTRLRRSGRFLSGGIFVTLGVTTALTGSRTQ